MADIAQAMRYKIDVTHGLVKQPMAGVLMRGDKKANRIIAELVDGDKTVTLDGVTVTGKFFRGGDGIEIPLDGTASGNEASVLLDEHCYAVDGYFEASVKLTTGGATRTILTITGHVESDGEGGILDIENVIPSVEDIVAQYQRMQEVTAQTEAATKTANDAAANANTATGKANTAANNANKQAEAAKSAAAAANAAAKSWGDSTAANSTKLGGKAPEYYLQPHNLLVNSWFGDYVNQRGSSDYTVNGAYTIDMWYLGAQNTKAVVQYKSVKVVTTVGSAYASLCQKVQNIKKYAGKTLTFAAYVKSNVVPKINVYNGSDSIANKEGTSGSYQVLVCSFAVPSDVADNAISVRILSKSTQADDYIEVQWAALYEGSYTADTLPPYVPKGYAAELTECQRYYYRIPTSGARMSYVGYTAGTNTVRITIPTPIPMRTTPSLVFPDGSVGLSVYTQSGTVGVSSAQVTHSQSCATAIEATTTSTVAEWVMCAARFTVSAALSAEP